jgi:hypothetical protein
MIRFLDAVKRVMVFTSKLNDLGDFCGGDILCVNTANASPRMMNG